MKMERLVRRTGGTMEEWQEWREKRRVERMRSLLRTTMMKTLRMVATRMRTKRERKKAIVMMIWKSNAHSPRSIHPIASKLPSLSCGLTNLVSYLNCPVPWPTNFIG
ncbi:hypothetical protein PMAYCL1PPCAC_29389 [Pristionchus mayeri]|uniref:Uncharacterized protein n=1 Tax=Pristionchus mayeri TaxID=1317129 RepID=A0AAN5D9Y7_9BILA|nr:hypothetical protein PMAYCL1PPCAC_29389 [Pristionchus mayeri]